MCRLYGFRATDETKVECTLVHAQNALLMQSRADRLGESHPDGWGVSYYRNALPIVERRASAAFQDTHFSSTAERVFSRTVVAHVRMASVGTTTLENTHPFVFGHWSFAHNGTVRGFEMVGPQLAAETDPGLAQHRVGQTDSEQLFYWLLTRLMRAGFDIDASISDISAFAREVGLSLALVAQRCAQTRAAEPATLNVLITDGQTLIGSRWKKSLWLVERDGVRDCEICGTPHIHTHDAPHYRAVVIASEPISDENWIEIPDETIVAVDADVRVSLHPAAAACRT